MTNEIAKTDDYTALDAAIGADMDGEIFRFNGNTGVYSRGPDKAELPHDTKLLFAPTSIQDGWNKWADDKIIDTRFREWHGNPPQLPIFRDALDELDKVGGKDDPWQFATIAAFKDAEGVQLKYTTGSKTGTSALRKVLRLWRQKRSAHPAGFVPVVQLQSDSYVDKERRNEIHYPVFVIVDWAPWDTEGIAAPPKALPPAVTADDPRTQMREELNDDLPDWARAS